MSSHGSHASRFSEVETARFNLDTYRFDADAIDDPLIKSIDRCPADLVILRVPTTELHNVSKLAALGVAPLVADTLVYYEYRCSAASSPAEESSAFRLATDQDRDGVSALCLEVFRDYQNHYSVNPLIDPAIVPIAYAEWADSHIAGGSERSCWLALVDEQIVAMAAVHKEERCYEIVLNCVARPFQNRGIYTLLLKHLQQHAESLRFETVLSSTQVGNLAPQKAWVRNGFVPIRAVHTIHLNLLRSRAKKD